MADDHTQFSCSLKLKSVEDALFAIDFLEAMRTEDDTFLDMCSFQVSILDGDKSSAELWLRDAYGAADIMAVIEFVARLAREVGSTGYWGFQYSLSCSKPRLNEFGGGAIIINLETGDIESATSTEDWFWTNLRNLEANLCSP